MGSTNRAALDLSVPLKVKRQFKQTTCIFCLFVQTISADPPDEDIVQSLGNADHMVSIATGYLQPHTDAPAVTSIITAEDIRRIGALTLTDVLETVPGIHVSTANGFSPVFVVRGMASRTNAELLILVNGFKVNDVVLSGRFFPSIPLIKNIARIEIIRGPGSAVYGADAYAGVINLVTQSGENIDGASVGTFAGSFGTYGGWFLGAKDFDSGALAVSVQGKTTDGFDQDIEADNQTRFDQLFGTSASRAPGSINVQRDDISVDLNASFGDRATGYFRYDAMNDLGNGAGSLLALDPEGHIGGETWLAGLRINQEVSGWHVVGDLSYLRHRISINSDVFPAGAFGGLFQEPVRNTLSFTGQRVATQVSAVYEEINRHVIRWGVGFNYDESVSVAEKRNFLLTSDGQIVPAGQFTSPVNFGQTKFGSAEKRYIYYGLLQDEWKFIPDWSLVAGVRFDYYSDFEWTINPRVSLIWNVDPTLTGKVLYGRAFRAPSLFELYAQSGLFVRGNESLDPQTIDTVDLSFEKQWNADVDSRLNLFWYDMKNLILENTPGSTTNTASTYRNSPGGDVFGLEYEMSFDLFDQLDFSFNYTWINPSRGVAIDQFLLAAPRHKIFAQLNWEFLPQWHINLRSNWIIDRQRAGTDPRSDLDDYTQVDLTLRRTQWLNHVDIVLGVKNLLDDDLREPNSDPFAVSNDYPLTNIAFLGQIDVRF